MHGITLVFQRMSEEIRQLNIEKGWRNPDGSSKVTVPEALAMLHSEVSEALEAWREGGLKDQTQYRSTNNHPKPEGVGAELADVLIRLIDNADAWGIDLAGEYRRKMAYNITRPYRHGGKAI